MAKKVEVLKSRNVAQFAAQESLSKIGIIGEQFVVEEYVEVKRGSYARFVVLFLKTNDGAEATVAVRLAKVENAWVATQARILGTKNAPYRRLAYAEFRCSPEEAVNLIASFTAPFPSLGSVEPKDVVRAVTQSQEEYYEVLNTPYEERGDNRRCVSQMRAYGRIKKAIKDASYGDEWPGKVVVQDRTTWCPGWELTLTPYVGDRFLTVRGGNIGTGHGQSQLVYITVDCLFRPSSSAMAGVIGFAHANPHAVDLIAWAGDTQDEKRDPWEDHKEEWDAFFQS